MFQATFLGHHGWLFESNTSRVLVDPLLTPRIGFTDAIELFVYPPRNFDFSKAPPIDAMLLTHEHEGHFDIPTLQRLDRKIPIYISVRTSMATRKFITEMGFSVRLMHPGRAFQVGELEVLPMTGDQVKYGTIEEWDVLPYLIRDLSGDGSFFSHVDMMATSAMWKAAHSLIERPGLWAYTNNFHDYYFQDTYRGPNFLGVQSTIKAMLENYQSLCEGWDAPEALLVIGGGFCFGGPQTWLNRNAFYTSCEESQKALSYLLPTQKSFAPIPGQTLIMKEGKLISIEESSFVFALPRAEWPDRSFSGEIKWMEHFDPACGQKIFSESDLPLLQNELNRFAEYLYGTTPFQQLYSMTEEDFKGKLPTFALNLLANEEGASYTFAYEPQSCSFVLVECEDPGEFYAGLECWASDLLAHLCFEISPNAIGLGRCRAWNINPEAFSMDINTHLFIYAHQLRHPKRALELYRKILASLPAPNEIIQSAHSLGTS
jgi:hypothetical protein